ncbi:Dilute domain-containing [Lecanosticta acicola]|uniref:Dilute domain-containing n=1 Tax=Lecanosticta acicola TaxID=111012 RepID=A0AAI8YZQ5_9PEZI|nr:Dilute domain-containing [Lecanosticta acicola]
MDADEERDPAQHHDSPRGEEEEVEQENEHEHEHERPRELPADLPRTLDDRQNFRSYNEETEYYDAWQGQSQFLTAPTIAKPSNFNLALQEPDDDAYGRDFGNDEVRIAQMMAAKRKSGDAGEQEEDEILENDKLNFDQKAEKLQEMLYLAARNGDVARVQRLVRGPASDLVDIDGVDAEGSPALVYASCFGNKDTVVTLLNARATVDKQDKNQWTALMWAITNSQKEIARILLDHGASTDVKSSSGRTALDFVPKDSEMSEFFQHSGYSIGNVGVASDDYYNSGFSQDRFEEELAESEMRRRMMMESAINLEVDLGNLGLDEQPESPEDFEDGQEFVWDRCLNDQMFVFMENDIERYLDIVITKMTPQRSASQKPVPANIIFLGARYAHYHASKELLAEWLESAQDKIYAVVDRHQWDMTILAFWISNATLLLYYLKKDTGLGEETTEFQAHIAELIHEIFILIIRDAERRMDKVLDAAVLDHETIPGFEDITFQNEWKFLKSKKQVKPEPVEKRFRPPSPKRKAQPSPRNITSLLSSTLFVLDLYDVHSVITAQTLSQLYYWLSAEIFNRIMSNKRYLARTKAMQIRMNISTLEDWARTNNRQPEHYDNGSMNATGETTVDSARRHLAPVVQLLQWLQCFSSLGEDREAMETTIQQLPSLSTKQLLHAVKYYRAEVGEKNLSRPALRHIQEVKSRPKSLNTEPPPAAPGAQQAPSTPNAKNGSTPVPPGTPQMDDDSNEIPESNLMNPAILLPFHLPTSTDMLVSYGSGFGGMNKERERRYFPSVPAEFLAKLDPTGGQESSIYENAHFSDTNDSS